MKLEIFDKYTRIRIGIINVYNYVSYSDEFNGPGRFEIKIPILSEILYALEEGNYILFEEGVVGIIKRKYTKIDESEEIVVTGFLTNHIFEYRSFLLTSEYCDYFSIIARQMVSDLIINPEDERRKIDFIKLATDEKYFPILDLKVRYQNTGDTLLYALSNFLLIFNCGFKLYPILSNYIEGRYEANIDNLEFRVLVPSDRTVSNNEGNTPVVFSFELNNLNSMIYDEDSESHKNVAIVAAEGVGKARHLLEVGELESSGIDRIEIYVDARDLQPDEEESETEMEQRMKQRGLEKLSGVKRFVSFDGTINTGDGKYTYGVDFLLGDYVTVHSKELNKMFNVQITKVDKSISDGVEYLDISFGYDKLSIKKISG